MFVATSTTVGISVAGAVVPNKDLEGFGLRLFRNEGGRERRKNSHRRRGCDSDQGCSAAAGNGTRLRGFLEACLTLMQAATWGANDWHTRSRISLFVKDFGPDTTDGFLIKGGRVEISSANSRKAWDRHHEWGERVRRGTIRDMLAGSVRMTRPQLLERPRPGRVVRRPTR
jgi:hypothetical protein